MIKSLVMMLVAMVFVWGNFARAVDYDFDPPDIPDPPDIDRPSISDIDRSGGFTSFDSPDRVDYPKHRTYDYDTRRSYPRDYDRRGYRGGRTKQGVRHRRYETKRGTPKPLEQIRKELKERAERLKKQQSE